MAEPNATQLDRIVAVHTTPVPEIPFTEVDPTCRTGGGTRKMKLLPPTKAPKKKKGAAKKGTGKKKAAKEVLTAKTADRHILYQASVQDPESDIKEIAKHFRGYTGTPLRRMREDFAGTAHLSCAFAAAHKDNHAYAVDLDRETLEWGARHNLTKLKPAAQERVTLIQGDVRAVHEPQVQLINALNFSYSIFQTRADLKAYFQNVHRSLEPGGVFMMDMWGGSETHEIQEEDRTVSCELGKFTYVWDQADFDPATYRGVNKIHFRFKDGSEIQNAYVYDWRHWTMPELLELLGEAGFEDPHFLWEGTDKDTGEGNGVYKRRKRAEPDPSYIAYVVGLKPA